MTDGAGFNLFTLIGITHCKNDRFNIIAYFFIFMVVNAKKLYLHKQG